MSDTSVLPPDVPLEDYGDIVAISIEDGFLTARAVSDDAITVIDPPLQRALLAADYEILAHDNEGFEAEIFFARGSETVGTILMNEGPCPDQVTLRLRYGAKRYEKRG